MWELTKRISLRTSSVLFEVEPDLKSLHRLRLRPKSTGSDRLRNTGLRGGIVHSSVTVSHAPFGGTAPGLPISVLTAPISGYYYKSFSSVL